MTQIRVLVVDDSRFMRNRLTEIISDNNRLVVIGEACNGAEAIEKTRLLKPDVITMDIEMPVMNGVLAVREIMKCSPTPILMLSVLTVQGARASIEALEAGAMDFLPKKLEEINSDRTLAKLTIQRRLLALGQQAGKLGKARAVEGIRSSGKLSRLSAKDFDLLLIAGSTGAPAVAQKILAALPKSFPWPILLIQHMPSQFTSSYADRVSAMSQIKVVEASDGVKLCAGQAFIAPGGKQLELPSRYQSRGLQIRDGSSDEFYKPSADITFRSVATNFKGRVLIMILTGMGADGRNGCMAFKETNSSEVWAQSEASCSVFGMPKAVIDTGLANKTYSPEQMIQRLPGTCV